MIAPLTSLRFFAALAVALYHVPFVLPLSANTSILQDGYLGVGFFFSLSGFILTHAASSNNGLDGYYVRRIARILPLHYLTFVTWIFLFFNSWGNGSVEKINSGIANILLLQAFFNGAIYNLGYNAVSWSLSVEIFFYAIFPLIFVGNRRFIIFAFYIVIFFLMTPRLFGAIESIWPNFFYFNPFARLFEFCGGMVAYSLYRNFFSSYSGATFIQFLSISMVLIAAALTYNSQMYVRNFVMFFAFAILIISFACDGILARALSVRFFVILGEASFSLYMVHHMLFRLIDSYLFSYGFPIIGAVCAAIALAVMLSVLIYFSFEQPIRSRLSKVRISVTGV